MPVVPTSPDPDPAKPLSPRPFSPGLGVFRHPDYAAFWASRFLATLAVACEGVTIGWQVYAVARLHQDVEHSAFMVGMVGLAQFVPLFVLTLFAGETTDRYDRKIIMLVCLAVEMVCDLGLAALAFTHQGSLLPIFLIAGVFGITRAFPTTSALAPMLVPREELPQAVAWSSLAWQTAAVIGPLIAGVLVAISPATAYMAAAVLYLGATIATALIRGNTKPEYKGESRLALIKEGIAYVWTNQIVFGAISLDLFAVLLGGATALLPVYAKDVLHVGANGFGILRAGPAVGASLTALALSRHPIRQKAGLWTLGGVAIFGVATLVFAVSKILALSVIALAVLGAGDMVSVYVRQILVQIATPDIMRGRVSAISSVFVGASNELGEFETGVMARWLGPIGAAVFGGIGSLIVVGVWAKLFPALRKADQLVQD